MIHLGRALARRPIKTINSAAQSDLSCDILCWALPSDVVDTLVLVSSLASALPIPASVKRSARPWRSGRRCGRVRSSGRGVRCRPPWFTVTLFFCYDYCGGWRLSRLLVAALQVQNLFSFLRFKRSGSAEEGRRPPSSREWSR